MDDEELAPNGHGQLWVRLLEVVLYVVLIIPQRHLKRTLLKEVKGFRRRLFAIFT